MPVLKRPVSPERAGTAREMNSEFNAVSVF